MKTYVLLSEKSWHDDLYINLQNKIKANWGRINNKSDFSFDKLIEIKPDKVFIAHWSYIIFPEIFNQFECIVFHMTDLPYGRGGSPLQNLIVRGHTATKISALKVVKELDAGPIYLKKDLFLVGSAKEIFKSANQVIELMIIEIISKDLEPKKQKGEILKFKRRKPEESNMAEVEGLKKAYDYIRMLDADGYPHAFLETSDLKLEFTNANFNPNDEIVTAHVRIFKK